MIPWLEWFDDFSYTFKLFSSGETVTDAVILSRNNIANTTEHKLSTGSAVSAISAEAAETFRERSRRGKHGKGGQISDDEGDYQALSVVFEDNSKSFKLCDEKKMYLSLSNY